MEQKQQPQQHISSSEREQRVADALRENLRKRKAQAQAQQATAQSRLRETQSSRAPNNQEHN